ncbi:MAG: bifunctional UDP-N-acetylglucosamine diphosphorylase/glucosamine-1-phosphate N-acetyltransferase GlmU [Clostridiales bacterium]|nr:bifunctional UDP-N-acetylglucosamine diphosphorylase/glucosamine-1-phosphate N-acetyltransferase GlmU [Clostridiales bacterium]
MKVSAAVILAAGRGTRMNSAKPTALHEVGGKPIIDRMLVSVAACSASLPVIVENANGLISAHVGEKARFVIQPVSLGEADALLSARAVLEQAGDGLVLVLYGNLPLIETEYIDAVIRAAEKDRAAMLVFSDEETEELQPVGVFCFEGALLLKALLDGEACDTVADCAASMAQYGVEVHELMISAASVPQVRDRAGIAFCESVLKASVLEKHFAAGVTILDPVTTHIGEDVVIGRDTVIHPGVILSGRTEIGEGSVIKGGCQLHDTRIGSGCTLTYVVADDAVVGNNVKIGPFVNLRPKTVIADGCKIGDFVEIKNSNVGEGTKLPHLSYIGDADVGSGVNVGCGCVFVNYDGFKKHRTTVGNNVFLGCQTNLVAPVTVGDDAYTAAGSTITQDVPAGAMAFARVKQSNKIGYVEKFRSLKKK